MGVKTVILKLYPKNPKNITKYTDIKDGVLLDLVLFNTGNLIFYDL